MFGPLEPEPEPEPEPELGLEPEADPEPEPELEPHPAEVSEIKANEAMTAANLNITFRGHLLRSVFSEYKWPYAR